MRSHGHTYWRYGRASIRVVKRRRPRGYSGGLCLDWINWRRGEPVSQLLPRSSCRLGITTLAKRLVLRPVGTHDNYLRATRRAAQREGDIRHVDTIREAIDLAPRLVLARLTGSIHRTARYAHACCRGSSAARVGALPTHLARAHITHRPTMPICPMINIANHVRDGSYPGLKLVNMVDAPVAARTRMTGPTQRRHRHAGPCHDAIERSNTEATKCKHEWHEGKVRARTHSGTAANVHVPNVTQRRSTCPKTFDAPQRTRSCVRKTRGESPQPFRPEPARAVEQ